MYKKIRTWIMLALTLMIGLGTSFGAMPTATAAESQQASRLVICKGQTVPDNYVITAHTYSFSCPGTPFLENAWVIQIPGDTARVCQGQKLPDGYVITASVYTVSCPEIRPFLPNTWVIQRV
ncbi:MAG: hypothetical protein AAGF95_32430 [Chloroflexota bacterium]